MIKTKEKGMLIVVSAPSGCGKDTVVREVMKTNHNLWISVSCTSRSPREGETNGKDYFFLTKEEFERKIEENDFLEYAEYAGNYYGTPKSKIQEKLNAGIDVVLIIEIQGALKIKEILPETLFIFILPPSMKELKNRLLGRNTETKEKAIERFKTAYKEINEVTKYNYAIVNDKIEDAAKKINSIITAEKCRVDRIEEVYLNNPEEEMHELLLDDKEFVNKNIEI